MENKENLTKELEKLIREFRSYKRLLQLKSLTKVQEGYMYSLRSTLQRKMGTYGELIIGLTGKQLISESNYRFDFWVEALRADGYIPRTLNSIETCIQTLNEAIGKLGSVSLTELIKEKAQSPIELFDSMQFHSKVIEASKSCFETGNYREAILNAFIALIDYVKENTGLDLDGDDLMNQAFSFDYDNKQKKLTKSPIIWINPLTNKTERDEQQGMMFLCKGAVAFVRNPKAHTLIPQTNPLHTLEYLAFASILFRRLDEGRIIPPNGVTIFPKTNL